MCIAHRSFALSLLVAGALAGSAPPARAAGGADGEPALQARLQSMQHELAHSPFGRPVVLRSSGSDTTPHGEVFALIDHPFPLVASALQRAQNWCSVLLLQTNIKRCTAGGEGGGQRLDVGIARRYTDPVDDAQHVVFAYRVLAAQPQYLSVELSAPSGPVGTSNYGLRFEAAPAGGDKTFVHFSYAYEAGTLARIATGAYLASSGKDKVGFTVVGRDDDGRPRYVGGIQGVAERNTMRYFLAIDAFLDTLGGTPPQRLAQRLREFHAALEHYPAQLHETQWPEYRDMKRREIGHEVEQEVVRDERGGGPAQPPG